MPYRYRFQHGFSTEGGFRYWIHGTPVSNTRVLYVNGGPPSLPGHGTWRAGDLAFETGTSFGTAVGWRCTVSGTPGTWVRIGDGGIIVMGAGGQAYVGRTTIDFGAFPGAPYASVNVIGQTNITADAILEAFILPEATADHSVDEHMCEPLRFHAGNIIAGTGFTIYGTYVGWAGQDQFMEGRGSGRPPRAQGAPMPYGTWTVGWRYQDN